MVVKHKDWVDENQIPEDLFDIDESTKTTILVAATENTSIDSTKFKSGTAILGLYIDKAGDNDEDVTVRIFTDPANTAEEDLTTINKGVQKLVKTDTTAGNTAAILPVGSIAGLSVGKRLRIYEITNGEQFAIIESIAGLNVTINKTITFANGAAVAQMLDSRFAYNNGGWTASLTCPNGIDAVDAIVREWQA